MKRLFLLGLLFLLILSCGKKTVQRKYYVLEPPSAAADSIGKSRSLTDKICIIDMADVSPVYATTQMAIRSKSNQITYFYYHEWAESPAEAVTRFIRQEFVRSNIFEAVHQPRWTHPDSLYELRSELVVLEYAEGLVPEAHLKMDFHLYSQPGALEIASHSFNRRTKLGKRNLNEFAAAISRMLHQELSGFINDIRASLNHQSL
jgi:ABC-type uncharacterized transport system auxiliary subunit